MISSTPSNNEDVLTVEDSPNPLPVIGASWVTNDKALIVDASYLERVETEGLRVEFSYEDSDNFQRNLVTARVECFEDINIMRTDALIYGTF